MSLLTYRFTRSITNPQRYFYVADLVSERPSTGLTTGSLCFCAEDNSLSVATGDTAWSGIGGEGGGDLAAHVAAGDPHTGYQKESEKGQANGYASLDASGKVPVAQVPTEFVSRLILASDIATAANTTPVTLTGLSFAFEANSKYAIDIYGLVQAAAATTGCGFQLDVSAAVTTIGLTFFHQLANTGTLSGGSSISDDASAGVSSGVPATAIVPVLGGGVLVTGANAGTAQLRFRSETTAVITCKANTMMRVMKMN